MPSMKMSRADVTVIRRYCQLFPTVLMPPTSTTSANRDRELSMSREHRDTSMTSGADGDDTGSSSTMSNTKRYEAVCVLGSGASGTVLLVRNSSDRKQLSSMKIVKIGAPNPEESDDSFEEVNRKKEAGEVDEEEQQTKRNRCLSELHCLLHADFFSIIKLYDNYISAPPKGSLHQSNLRKLIETFVDADKSISMSLTQSQNIRLAIDREAAARESSGGASAARSRSLSLSLSQSLRNIPPGTSQQSSAKMTDDEIAASCEHVALVIEYANAGDLRQEIKRRSRLGSKLKEYEAGLLFLQLVMALNHLHDKSIMHRDIKSANVFLCTNGLVKLGDFGFSKLLDGPADKESAFCGTPYYLAPEIWRHEPYDTKVDMFALGVLLYEMLTLQRPFQGDGVKHVMKAIMDGRYSPLPDTISPEMRQVCYGLLDADAGKRPSAKRLLQLPIFKVLLGAFTEIVKSNETIPLELRLEVLNKVSETRWSLLPTGAPKAHSVNLLNELPEVVFEGPVKRESQGDSGAKWKKRYLRLLKKSETPLQFEVVFALNKEECLRRDRVIVTSVEDFDDCFTVPHKYSVGRLHCFTLLFPTGRRLAFQAPSAEDQQQWVHRLTQLITYFQQDMRNQEQEGMFEQEGEEETS